MAKPKRNPLERENDLLTIAKLYIQGKPQQEIADFLGLSRQQVTYDLADIRRRWQAETVYNLDEHKAQQLARLDAIEGEAWAAWVKSKNNRVRVRKETDLVVERKKHSYDEDDPRAMVPATRKIREVEGQVGNPAFLAAVMACVQERNKVLGLYAPTKGELSGPGGVPLLPDSPLDLDSLDPEERRQLLALMEKARK